MYYVTFSNFYFYLYTYGNCCEYPHAIINTLYIRFPGGEYIQEPNVALRAQSTAAKENTFKYIKHNQMKKASTSIWEHSVCNKTKDAAYIEKTTKYTKVLQIYRLG